MGNEPTDPDIPWCVVAIAVTVAEDELVLSTTAIPESLIGKAQKLGWEVVLRDTDIAPYMTPKSQDDGA